MIPQTLQCPHYKDNVEMDMQVHTMLLFKKQHTNHIIKYSLMATALPIVTTDTTRTKERKFDIIAWTMLGRT